MALINTFIWITPAFAGKIPGADHTWVTSYDNRKISHPDIFEVRNAQELYWYCKGDFHPIGKSSQTQKGLALSCVLDKTVANCLVTANDAKSAGTIRKYGIDGVCHQVTNQTISLSFTRFLQPLKKHVRGYKLSCIIYGLYGRRRDEWYKKRQACANLPRFFLPMHSHFMRSLFRFPQLFYIREDLELARQKLLVDIDRIMEPELSLDETKEQRADDLNKRINLFLIDSYSIISQGNITDIDRIFFKIFGVMPEERIDLIDSELLVIPENKNFIDR